MFRLEVLDACNPGPVTGPGNNTFLLASGGAAVLIDAGVGHPGHLSALGRVLGETGTSLVAVAATHGHLDHVSGAAALASEHRGARFMKSPASGDAAIQGVVWHPLVDGDEIRFGGESVRAVHTPGHAPDHIAFWHDPTCSLFTGDLLIAGGSVMIQASRGGNLRQYLESLERVRDLQPRVLWPAHGPCIEDPAAAVCAALEHRRRREEQVLEALRTGHRTVEAMAESIYDDLEPRLLAAAKETVRAHLEKLEADGLAADRDGWRLL
jgi:glyoxylase-like metal-dependent hydrolase (beta-lactamase superfamily II)